MTRAGHKADDTRLAPGTGPSGTRRRRTIRWLGTITPRAMGAQLLAAFMVALAGRVPMPYAWILLGLSATSAFATVLFSVVETRSAFRLLRVVVAAALYSVGSWLGGHPLALAATLVAMGTALIPLTWIEAARAVDNATQRKLLRQALEGAELAAARRVDREMRERLGEVEQAARALHEIVAHPTETPLANGVVRKAADASRTLREALNRVGGPHEALDLPTPVAPPAAGPQLYAHRIRRYWSRGMRRDVVRIFGAISVIAAPGLLVPGADLDPLVPLVLYPLVSLVGWLAAPGVGSPRAGLVLATACGFVTAFMGIIGLFVVRSGSHASLGYALGYAVCMMGHAWNLRATWRRPLMASPFVAGALLAAPFAYDLERLVNLGAALALGLVMGGLLGRSIEREDALLDQQEQLQVLLAADVGARVEASVAERRRELLDVSGRAHDASSPLVALLALEARTEGDPLAMAAAEPRARELCARSSQRLGVTEALPERAARASVADVARQVADSLALGGGHVHVSGPEVDVAMRSDHLERVVENLVANALHASLTATAHIAWVVDGARVRLAVSDDGPGLPGDAWPSAFASTRAGGAGLGSLAARLLVEATGGEVGAGRSSEHGGALVWCWIPCAAYPSA